MCTCVTVLRGFLYFGLAQTYAVGNHEHMTTNQQEGVVPEFTIGDRLRKAREHLGMEQGPFADLIGVSRGSVSNYERGMIDRYRPIVMRAWARETGVSLGWLETGQGSPTPPAPGLPAPADALDRLTRRKINRARHAEDSATPQYQAA